MDTDFQRGAEAMRDAIEAMLRAHSKDMEATAEASRKVVEIGAYQAAARLLWSYANGVMDMPLPAHPICDQPARYDQGACCGETPCAIP